MIILRINMPCVTTKGGVVTMCTVLSGTSLARVGNLEQRSSGIRLWLQFARVCIWWENHQQNMLPLPYDKEKNCLSTL